MRHLSYLELKCIHVKKYSLSLSHFKYMQIHLKKINYLLSGGWWAFHSTQASSIMTMKGHTSCLLTPCSSKRFLSSSRLWYDSSLIMKRAAPLTDNKSFFVFAQEIMSCKVSDTVSS